MKTHLLTLALTAILLCAATPRANAQEPDSLHIQATTHDLRTHSWAVGTGTSNLLDTYLSPLNYTGIHATLLRETLRMTRHCHHRLSFQTLVQATFASATNPSSTAHDYSGRLSYKAAWHYNWIPISNLRLMAGGMAGAHAGILYNDRNGNNPAQGRFSIDIALSAMAIYHLHIRHQRLSLRYQINMPIMGVMFSPQFGQSYYEIGQGSRDNNAVFTHPGNTPGIWHQLTIDVPIGKATTLRAGYLSDITQSHTNSIKTHDWSHTFMIGLVKHFVKVKKQYRTNGIL